MHTGTHTHSCQLDLPPFLCLSRHQSDSYFFFFHTILFQLKKPRANLFTTMSLGVSTSRPLRCIFFQHHLLLQLLGFCFFLPQQQSP